MDTRSATAERPIMFGRKKKNEEPDEFPPAPPDLESRALYIGFAVVVIILFVVMMVVNRRPTYQAPNSSTPGAR